MRQNFTAERGCIIIPPLNYLLRYLSEHDIPVVCSFNVYATIYKIETGVVVRSQPSEGLVGDWWHGCGCPRGAGQRTLPLEFRVTMKRFWQI